MELKPATPASQIPVYAYTQHVQAVQIMERLCGVSIKLLSQDRGRDPVEDILPQIPEQNVVLYAVLPIDKAIELRQRAPGVRLMLLQLDAKRIEETTGQPYNPKQEYPPEVIKQALKTIEVRGGYVKALSLEELQKMLQGKTAAVFNEALRQALQLLIPGANFVKACGDDVECVEINPPGNKSGIRISFPGTAGRLDVQQMAELIKTGARIYYAEMEATEVPPCP
jgi:hypothetical protein